MTWNWQLCLSQECFKHQHVLTTRNVGSKVPKSAPLLCFSSFGNHQQCAFRAMRQGIDTSNQGEDLEQLVLLQPLFWSRNKK